MSLKVQSWVYQYSEATGNERLILLAIADEADDDGTNAYPGIERISHKARVNKRTTMRCIERLEADCRLIVKRPEVKGRGHHNTYVVIMVEDAKGDTLAPFEHGEEKARHGEEKARNGDRKARNGAQSYLIGSRPIDPQTQDPPTTSCGAINPLLPAPSAASAAIDKPSRPRNLPFEALCGVCGIDWNELTDVERKRIAHALKQIRGAWRGTDEDLAAAIATRAEHFRNAWDVPLTPMALAGRWASIARVVPIGNRLTGTDRGLPAAQRWVNRRENP